MIFVVPSQYSPGIAFHLNMVVALLYGFDSVVLQMSPVCHLSSLQSVPKLSPRYVHQLFTIHSIWSSLCSLHDLNNLVLRVSSLNPFNCPSSLPINNVSICTWASMFNHVSSLILLSLYHLSCLVSLSK